MTDSGPRDDPRPQEGDVTATTEVAEWKGPHGHVNPRADGQRKDCAGLGGCPECAQEYAEAMHALAQAQESARSNLAADKRDGKIGDAVAEVSDAAALRARIPHWAWERAEREGKSPEEFRGDVMGERREMLRANRARLWAETLRTWPDDDLARAGLDSLEPGQQPQRIIEWLRDLDAKVLILAGETGRGKTYAQFAMGNHYAGRGFYVVAISHKRYLDALTPGGSDEPEWLTRRRGTHAEVLIIDGFGDEMDPTAPASEFRLRETADLLSARLGKGKRTIISTNLTPDRLSVMFGDRIISRLRQGSTVLRVTGVDRRSVGSEW